MSKVSSDYFYITNPDHIYRFGIDEISHGCGIWKPVSEELAGKEKRSLFCQTRCLLENKPNNKDAWHHDIPN